MPFGWSIASSLVFRKVRLSLGLDRCRLCLTAAAPIMRDTLDFFSSLDMPLLEIFGMSESSGQFCALAISVQLLAVVRRSKSKNNLISGPLAYNTSPSTYAGRSVMLTLIEAELFFIENFSIFRIT